jgi:hypothetical protein
MLQQRCAYLAEAWPESLVHKILLCLCAILDAVVVCSAAASQIAILREYVPHPMAILRPVLNLSERYIIATPARCLCLYKTIDISL